MPYRIKEIVHKHFDKITSTQDIAKGSIDKLQPNQCLLFTADQQINGIATNNKKWESPPGCNNIYSTFVMPFPKEQLKNFFNIPQIVGYIIVESLKQFDFDAKLKWVNDILINKKKVGGILCETIYPAHLNEYVAVLIGIGLNVNMPPVLCRSIDQPTTSLMIEHNKIIDKSLIFNKLQIILIEQIQLFINYGFTTAWYHKINQILEFVGATVIVDKDLNTTSSIEGVIRGIDPAGLLLIDTGSYIARTTSRNLSYILCDNKNASKITLTI